MDGPLVSVIVPVYNVASYVREALDSVVNQTYRNLEILIIDDGSTDGSEAICDEYRKDPRVKVIHQDNIGLSGARNTGLDLMTGELVAFLDSDDYFYPEMIEKLVQTQELCNADIVICNFEWNGTTYNLKRATYNSIEALKVMVSGKMELAVWNKLYRCEIWNGIRFPVGHNYEGMRTTYKLLEKADRVEVIPDCLMFHRTRSDSIVQTPSKKNVQDFILACEEFESYVINNTPEMFSDKERNRFTGWRFRHKLRYWNTVRKNDSEMARELVRNIIEGVPSTDSWDKKTRIKYEMLRSCPGLLKLVMDTKDKLQTIRCHIPPHLVR